MYRTILFEGRKVAYRVDGEGDALVLLHGFCEDSTIWDEFIEGFEQIKVVRVDIGGHGQSEVQGDHRISTMARSVKAVLDALHISSCVMVGHSMGGYVTMAFAELWPNMLNGVGMFHSHPFADTEDRIASRRKSIDFISKFGHALYVKQLFPGLFANLFATSNELLINRLIHNASRYPKEAITGALQAMISRPDRAHVMASLECPVLVIIGKQDTTIPYDISMKQTHLPKVADIHILPRVAHMGMFRSTDETSAIVKGFVQFCKRFRKA